MSTACRTQSDLFPLVITSGKRSLVGKMLIQGLGDMKLRLIFEQLYEALTSEIINKD